MGNGLTFRDNTFHKGLDESAKFAAATAAAFELSGSKDGDIKKAIAATEKTIGALTEKFSRPASRLRKGGKLSSAEKKKLASIKAKNKELEKRLKRIESKVRKNAKAMRGLEEIRERSLAIDRSRNTLADFLAAIVAINIIDGLLWGCHWWWGPWGGWYPGFSVGWVEIHTIVVDDFDYDWDYYGDLQADVDDIDLVDAVDEADAIDDADFLDAQDLDPADALDQTELAGLVEPEAGELDALSTDTDSLEPAPDTAESGEDLETAEPEVDEVAEQVQDIEPPVEDLADDADLGELDDSGLDDGGFDDVGGFDDSGFDDLDGGFEFD